MKKIPKLKSSRAKKSQGTIIAVILIILLCLIVIIILWRVIFPMLQSTKEETKIRQELSKTQMEINEVSGDIAKPIDNKINITLSRSGGEELILINQTMKSYNITRTITEIILTPHYRTIPIVNSTNETVTIIKNGSVDIVFAIDTTGSMSTDIIAVKKIIRNFTSTLFLSNITYRLALVEFKDYPTSPCGSSSDFSSKIYQYKQGDFTNNLSEFNNSLNQLVASGGADGPESHLTAVDNASDLDFNATKSIIILITDSQPHAKDCYYSSSPSSSTWASCYLGPWYILSGPGNMKDKLNSKNISLYYLNYNVCYNNTDVKLANQTGGEYFTYTAATAAVDVPKILMNISNQINVTRQVNETIYINETYYVNETYYTNETINKTITEVIYEPAQIWQSLKVIVYNDSSSYTYTMPKNTSILAPQESKTYTIDTGPMVNINKIDIYIVVKTEQGKEISELVSTWTPDTKNY